MKDHISEIERFNIESNEGWRTWAKKMPYLKFDSDWEVAVIPPFAGAIARFVVKKESAYVSIYFDAYSRLGWMWDEEKNEPSPYWEIYPAADGDVSRYYLGEENQMIDDIRKSLFSQSTEKLYIHE